MKYITFLYFKHKKLFIKTVQLYLNEVVIGRFLQPM